MAVFSYETILNNMRAWRGLGGAHSATDFALYDQPSKWYFRIFFYFYNSDSSGSSTNNTGLLAPTWDNDITDNSWYDYPTAYAFLKMNDENERADKLKTFVTLLSNISSQAPWYFTEISGLDEALKHNGLANNKLTSFSDDPNFITIKCRYESMDERIGTLMDLYREIAFSWQGKKEILPRNLRKFDMGIYVFQAPIKNIHTPGKSNSGTDYAFVGDTTSGYMTSYKYFELHNCEIDPNSGRAWYGSLNNKEGFGGPDTGIDIKITFDDIYEHRYNEFMAQSMGDFINIDMGYLTADDFETDTGSTSTNSNGNNTLRLNRLTELNNRLTAYNTTGLVNGAITTVLGAVKNTAASYLTSIYLGNIYGLSAAHAIADSVNLLQTGNIFNISSVKNDIVNSDKKAATNVVGHSIGNIYSDTIINSLI